MQIELKAVAPERQRCDCVVVAVGARRRLGERAAALDAASAKGLSGALRRMRFSGRAAEVATLQGLEGVRARTVVAVGIGDRTAVEPDAYRRALAAAAVAVAASGARNAVVALDDVEVDGRDAFWSVRQVVAALGAESYRFDRFRKSDPPPPPRLDRVTLAVASADAAGHLVRAVEQSEAIVAGSHLARELGDLPANVCTPSYLATRARSIARDEPSLSATVRGEREIKRLGMGALLAVARGSREPPRLITLEHRGAAASAPPVVLVGKGVTFDSGGISIKPAAAMDEMKFDMCGAASVLGATLAAARLRLPLNVVAVVPATENLPGGKATRPGDIVRTRAGLHVEILNTDAEGRLILCDALDFARRFRPLAVVDVATLTGACVVALGAHASGLFSRDERLAAALESAGRYSGDRAWRMPLWDEYGEQLKSRFADLANVGGREAGAITAASFLARFTDEMRWAHLDIAGTAWKSGRAKGATGRPVPLLVQFLLDCAADGLPQQ